MTDKELKGDIKEAKKDLEIHAKEVSGMFQLWNILTSAKVMSEAFDRDLKNLSYEACMAFTKAIVVEYSKPWTTNQSKMLNSIKSGKSYVFLDELEKSPEHVELLELRDKMVAHIDQGYESHAVTLRGLTVKSSKPGMPQQEGTLDDVFFPLAVRAESNGSMWWINNHKKIKELVGHIQKCVIKTQETLKDHATDLRNKTFDHAHVLKHITDIAGLEEFKVKNDEGGKMNIEYLTTGQIGHPSFSLKSSKPLKLGKSNVQGTIGLFEPSPNLGLDTDIEGKGYRLRFKIDDSGKGDFDITFPKYPYPKIKPKPKKKK